MLPCKLISVAIFIYILFYMLTLILILFQVTKKNVYGFKFSVI